jgi:hypothetical protein
MKSNNIHKIFEDKIDKLVHDTFINETNASTDNEWQALKERLHETKGTRHLSRNVLAGLLLFLLGAGSTFLYLKNSTNKPYTTSAKNLKKQTLQKTNTSPIVLNKNKLNGNSKSTDYNINRIESQKNILSTEMIKAINLMTKQYANRADKDFSWIIQNENYLQSNNGTKKTDYLPNGGFKNSKEFAETDDTEIELELTSLKKPASQLFFEPILLSDALVNKNLSSLIEPRLVQSLIIANKLPKTKPNRKPAPDHYFDNEKTFYIEAFSGFNNSAKTENTFAAFLAPNGYTNMRLKQESALPSASAGVQFKVRQRHITFSSGLQYLQLGDVVQYDTSFNNSSFVINANGRTTFSYMELPFLAGYEWANKRWGFTLQGGFSTGLLTQLKGNYASIQNFNTQLFDVNQNKNTFRKAIFNVVLQPQLQYFINGKTNLFAAPTYKRNLQSITKIEADLKQRYQILGIQVGIRTRLNQ